MLRRAPSRPGTTPEEYMRFWVHSLESASKMADDLGDPHTHLPSLYTMHACILEIWRHACSSIKCILVPW